MIPPPFSIILFYYTHLIYVLYKEFIGYNKGNVLYCFLNVLNIEKKNLVKKWDCKLSLLQ